MKRYVPTAALLVGGLLTPYTAPMYEGATEALKAVVWASKETAGKLEAIIQGENSQKPAAPQATYRSNKYEVNNETQ